MMHPTKRGRLRAPPGTEAFIGLVIEARYRIEGWIGGGGFSNVYLAVDQERDNRQVAIKVIHRAHAAHAEAQSGYTESNPFEHEARYNRMLKNAWSTRTYRAGRTSDGLNYIIMDFVPGPTLERLVRNEGPLSFSQIFELGEGLLTYLSEAHYVGFAHGDIKSSNIMVSDHAENRLRFKVIDLGHAYWFRTPTKPRDHMVGTPAYIAPEIVDGGKIDPRAEIYAVGVVLYKALTGQPPIQTKRNSADEALEYLRKSNLPIPTKPVQSFRPDCPKELEDLVMRALNRNRALRPSTVENFLTEWMEVRSTLPTSFNRKSSSFIKQITRNWNALKERITNAGQD